MCLGIPGCITAVYHEHDLRMGKVDFGGVSQRVCLEHVPEAAVGDYVLVHVGFALARLDEAEARQLWQYLEQMRPLDERPAEPSP
uniref:HypC/HybG/HupF family hydrogenase formation chaperone n=1 Tax=Schlesneria paludicola TaxID=360056 RepID=A0A7C4QTG9_9PLAN